jgi:hypothetical protein
MRNASLYVIPRTSDRLGVPLLTRGAAKQA